MDPFVFVFDLDGTLLDDVRLVENWVREDIPRHFGFEMTDDLYARLEDESRAIVSGANSKTLILGGLLRVAEHMGFKRWNKVRFLRYVQDLYMRDIPRAPMFPGAAEAVEAIKRAGGQVALFTTSSDKEVATRFQHKPEVYGWFDGPIITRSRVKNLKPSPEGLQMIAQATGVPTTRHVMVGDMSVDIQAGKAAGAKTVAVLTGYLRQPTVGEEGADLVLDSVKEIGERVEEILATLFPRG